jgi:hypothetical protein
MTELSSQTIGISGVMSQICVADFKIQFPRFNPTYLPVYIPTNLYANGDIVYYNGAFYQCIVASGVTSTLPTNTTDWTSYSDSVLNYTQDSDILTAMLEADINFNISLFPNVETQNLVFLYLTAFYLTLDFRNASGGNYAGITTSKSVGSVSEGYSIPQWVMKSPTMSIYASNGYGLKYLSLIYPYMIGNVILVNGATTNG